MKVKLIKLELTNYRNIEYKVFDFVGNSKIVGENRIGKTNTLEAIVWLLTDKLLNGSNDISSIKPIDDTRKEVRVEGTFSIWDENHPEIPPKQIVLRKEYGEDWVKTRGTEFESLKGHYLTYYYNGVKQKTKKDWYSLFYEDFGINCEFRGIDLLQLLTNPYYIGDLGESDGWTDLRAFIIQLIGDVKDDDVYAKDPSTMLIKEELRVYGGRLDQLKKQYSNEIKGLKEQLIGDDANIKMLEETPCPSDEEIAVANKMKEEIDEKLSKLKGDKANETTVIELEKELLKKRQELLEVQSKSALDDNVGILNHKLSTLNEEYRELLIKKSNAMENITKQKYELEKAKDTIAACKQIRYQIITQLRELDAKLNDPFDAVCPTCGRPLEGEQYELALNKRNSEINAKREELITKGKANKVTLDNANQFVESNPVESAEEEVAALQLDVENKKKQIESVNEELNIEKAKPREFKDNSQIYAQKEIIKDIESRIEIARADVIKANSLINEQIKELSEKLEPYNKILSNYEYAKHQRDRLEIVKDQKRNHSLKLASLEQKLELIALFLKIKLELLDEKVKTVFGNIRFQLMSDNLKEGSFNAICKPFIYDVVNDRSTNITWKSGSKSERVITGIAIAECIKRVLKLPDFPFLFDEGGEISEDTFQTRFNTQSQLICVKVKDNIQTPMVMKI